MSRVFCTPVCSAPRVRRAKGKCLRSRGHKKSHERSASDVSGDRTAEPGTRQPKAARRWQSNHLPFLSASVAVECTRLEAPRERGAWPLPLPLHRSRLFGRPQEELRTSADGKEGRRRDTDGHALRCARALLFFRAPLAVCGRAALRLAGVADARKCCWVRVGRKQPQLSPKRCRSPPCTTARAQRKWRAHPPCDCSSPDRLRLGTQLPATVRWDAAALQNNSETAANFRNVRALGIPTCHAFERAVEMLGVPSHRATEW